MGKVSRLKIKLKQSGILGVASGVLHHVANSIDRRKLNSNSEIKVSNEYLGWVTFAVQGMLEKGNINAIRSLIKNMLPGKAVLEIGSFCGLSIVVISHYLDRNSESSSIFSCDKWEFEGQRPGFLLGDSKTVTHDAYKMYVKHIFLNSMQTFSSHRLPYTIKCLSDELFRRWHDNEDTIDIFNRQVSLGGEIGFFYIDGNHTYELAKRDFENTDRILCSGGFILFDDSADNTHWEVNNLAREIAAGDKYDLISKNRNYLFSKAIAINSIQILK